jgi:hypothetical protein
MKHNFATAHAFCKSVCLKAYQSRGPLGGATSRRGSKHPREQTLNAQASVSVLGDDRALCFFLPDLQTGNPESTY